MNLSEEADVGIGVVYEQFMLNRLLERIVNTYGIKSALEAPVYGMAGISGINSIGMSKLGVRVTILDSEDGRLKKARAAWAEAKAKAEFVLAAEPSVMPFSDEQFDLAYDFAALWHVKDAEAVIAELARVSRVVLLCMPNPLNPMFQLRRLAGRLPEGRNWADAAKVKEKLKSNGFEIAEEGLLDIPPWPDTVVPLKGVLGKFGMKQGTWRWSMLDFYSGIRPDLKEKAMRYTFIEDSRVPVLFKMPWAHHFYVIGVKKDGASASE